MVRSEYSSLKSTKEAFDWDSNTIRLMSEESSEQKVYNKKINFMTESKVFDDTPIKSHRLQINHKSQLFSSGNILTWKDGQQDELKTSGKKRTSQPVKEVEINLYKTKSNKLFRSSDENTLTISSSRY